MDQQQYLAALTYSYKVEAAGAIAGEVCMLLREDRAEKRKLDIFRRLEASNKLVCAAALRREGAEPPIVEPAFYRAGFKLGQKFAAGDWDDFLNRFEATVHPEVFAAYLYDEEGNEIAHEYEGVDLNLLRHLVDHELSLVGFIKAERQHGGRNSTESMEFLLESDLCAGLVGPEDPVGW